MGAKLLFLFLLVAICFAWLVKSSSTKPRAPKDNEAELKQLRDFIESLKGKGRAHERVANANTLQKSKEHDALMRQYLHLLSHDERYKSAFNSAVYETQSDDREQRQVKKTRPFDEL